MYSSCAYPCLQLSDVARGLDYLHSCDVVYRVLMRVCDHPESRFVRILTPGQSDVLVDAEGRARIMGFRFPEVYSIEDADQAAFYRNVSRDWWSAPEIWENGEINKKAEIFSFAMVMIEARHGRSIMCRIWLTLVSC